MTIPYAAVEFTKSGDIARRDQADVAIELAGTATDVLLISHGWNNDIPRAERLFRAISTGIEDLLKTRPVAQHRFVVVGLLWPSQQWGSDAADTPGGALAAAGPEDDLRSQIDAAVDDEAMRLRLSELAGEIADDPDAREAFIDALRGLLPPADDVEDDDGLPPTLSDGTARALFTAVDAAAADLAAQAAERGDPLAAGRAAGLGDLLRNPFRRAMALLNVVTFYAMKDRAGKVGAKGVAELLDEIHRNQPTVRLHLAGHSFGARVVSMAGATVHVPIASMSLLQAAYSHRGLAAAHGSLPDGAFRRVLTTDRLTGPVIITHTRNDLAVGLAYALASRLARQVSSGLGDAGDPYGGLGANGAVGTTEVQPVPRTLGDEHEKYAFAAGKVYNLNADLRIRNHSDVTSIAIANVMLAAMTVG